jgi:hypothetical protein
MFLGLKRGDSVSLLPLPYGVILSVAKNLSVAVAVVLDTFLPQLAETSRQVAFRPLHYLAGRLCRSCAFDPSAKMERNLCRGAYALERLSSVVSIRSPSE